MKYIIFDKIGAGGDVPVIFPICLEHANVANCHGGNANVLSAGFVDISDAKHVSCFSHAVTIPDKPPREEDAKIIQRMIDKY